MAPSMSHDCASIVPLSSRQVVEFEEQGKEEGSSAAGRLAESREK